MRLLAYPAALVLASILYLSCPKLAPLAPVLRGAADGA